MANTLAELTVEINAQFDKVQAGFAQVQTGANKTQGIFSAMSVAIGGAAVMAGQAILQSLGDVMRKVTIEASNMADEILDVSKATGLTTDEVQKFKMASDMEGKSFENVTSMVKFYSAALKDARAGTGDAADVFKQLGIDVPSFALMSTGQQLDTLLPKINGITNANDRMTIGQKLLGRGFLENLDVINTYVTKSPEIEAAVKKFGIPADQLQTAAQLKETMGQLQFVFDNIAIKIGAAVIPALIKLEPLIMKIAGQMADWLNNPENLAALDRLVQGIGNVVDNIIKLMSAWDSANAKVGGNLGMLMNPMSAGASLLGNMMGFRGLATGGIVTQPQLAMVGEAGPEAVIPLDRLGSMGGGSNLTLNIGSYMGDEISKRALVRDIQRILNEENRRSVHKPTETSFYSVGGHL